MKSADQFSPSRWWRNRHLQTIWPLMTKPNRRPRLSRQRLELEDGDFLDLDWLHVPRDSAPILLILHGLEGSADSHYVRRLLLACEARGFSAVVMHQRSCSGEMNRLPRSYHSGETADLGAVLAQLELACPGHPVYAVGYSLGGNVLTKYLGEQGSNSAIERAAVVSAPLDLAQCAKAMERGFSQVYQNHLVKRLKRKTAAKLEALGPLPLPLEVSQLEELTTFYHFDDAVTAPLHGFAGADDYYRQASGNGFLHNIAVPTLLLHALDDPFMTRDVIPPADQISTCVELELCEYGGHVGFIEGGWPWAPRYYLERRLLKHFEITR
ncbi:hydrolase [Ferrimonas balearica]|uniref:hydrolase n=1 Tax=Ferrimonas balearica TaxID=44012 RepID=UPI001C995353|nr:hydrolase [Ferrimonas balearica]MBY5922429.1 hydrolase [Ferrimonas balearica]MBY5995413.1 hydrolase [Ferrimonas balearica]